MDQRKLVLGLCLCTMFHISGSSAAGVHLAGSSDLIPSKKVEAVSSLVNLKYHMGPVLTSKMHIYLVWYGTWPQEHKHVIRDFLLSISFQSAAKPSVYEWWNTVRLYTDQTGQNITESFALAGEHEDQDYSEGKSLTRLSIQNVLRSSLKDYNGSLPARSRGGLYIILTAQDVEMQDFCRAVCGFHYFSYSSIVGYTLPYAWIGQSGKQCPQLCAYPFAVSSYMGNTKPMNPPNGDIGLDGMISVVAHEIAEMASNPLINAWYAGQDPTAPTEIADLCEGMYGSGAGGSFPGSVLQDPSGGNYNLNGVNGRRFLVQWIWSPTLNACFGPNALA